MGMNDVICIWGRRTTSTSETTHNRNIFCQVSKTLSIGPVPWNAKPEQVAGTTTQGYCSTLSLLLSLYIMHRTPPVSKSPGPIIYTETWMAIETETVAQSSGCNLLDLLFTIVYTYLTESINLSKNMFIQEDHPDRVT